MSFHSSFAHTVEHRLVQDHVRPDSTVLELGARLGTVTCEVAKVQNNSGRIVAAEVDTVSENET